jgi:hypothetical protein
MAHLCEVCSSPDNPMSLPRGPSRLRRVLVGGRIVALCETHAAILRSIGASTLAELRSLFPEGGGRRSLVGQRAPLDRRVFPARPEGRRRGDGRRARDR